MPQIAALAATLSDLGALLANLFVTLSEVSPPLVALPPAHMFVQQSPGMLLSAPIGVPPMAPLSSGAVLLVDELNVRA